MIRPLLIASLTAATCAIAAEEVPDLLRFRNGDQLHGTFLGMDTGPVLLWQRQDVGEPVRFELKNLRHAVLRGGSPKQSVETLSQVELTNGDRIPGTITGLNESTITLDTNYTGKLELPRQHVTMMAPNPLGGRAYYHGPFSNAGWEMISSTHPQGTSFAERDPFGDEPQAQPAKTENATPPPPALWKLSAAAWYWQSEQAGTALIRRNCLPDLSILRFELAWKNQLNFAIALNADFAGLPKAAAGENQEAPRFSPNDSDSLPTMFGNSYILQVHSNYMLIYRAVIDKDGQRTVERIQMSNSRLRLGENAKAKFEIRSNRKSGAVTLFVDDEYITQWSPADIDEPGKNAKPPLGNGIGFMAQLNECAIRISDIIITEWNGMPDSARSMQVDDQDIVLMTNGLDRIAGKAIRIGEDKNLVFDSKHGQLNIPLESIAELRFARGQLASHEASGDQSLSVRLSPIGKLTGAPMAADRDSILIKHPLVGDLKIATDSVIMLELDSTKNPIDSWDVFF